MTNKQLLGINIQTYKKEIILEKIKEFINNPKGFYHIVSLNPENMIISQKLRPFKEVLKEAQIRLNDGIGINLACQINTITLGTRLTGVDLMQTLIEWAGNSSLRVMLIGGMDKLAFELAQCYQHLYPKAKFVGVTGITNITKPDIKEEKELFHIVARFKPHILFVAFGSPAQEMWLRQNRHKLEGIVCMGVGGAFDYLSGRVKRSPGFIQSLGLEWLYRLINEPWRWKRQLRLLEFVWIVLKQKLTKS